MKILRMREGIMSLFIIPRNMEFPVREGLKLILKIIVIGFVSNGCF